MVFLELRRHSRVTTGISAFPWGWPWEAQSSPRVARESWGLRSSHCRAQESSPRRVSGTSYSSPGKAGTSGLHSRLPRGVRPRLEGKPRTPLSSRVAPGISWTQLSGLKGVNPPVKFGERTRDCSPGQAGKEGPHLSLTGASCGFSRTAAPLCVFSRGTMGYSGSLLCGTREVSFPACGEGSASLLWSHGRGIGHQETLKKDSPSLSRVTSGNSGFPRLVPVTSGSFSGSL